jgi:hypothetical protein
MPVHRLAVAFVSVLLCTSAVGVQINEDSLGARISVQACVRKYADGLDQVQENLSHAIRQHPLKMVHTSRRNVTICAGSGTTATKSLHYALGFLGVCSWHFETTEPWHQNIYGVLNSRSSAEDCHKQLQGFDYTSLPGHVEAVGDTPMAEVFLDMFLSFPNAKVILLHRPSVEWAEKRLHFERGARVPIQEPCGSGMQMKDFTIPQNARLEDLKNDLIKCLVPEKNMLLFSPWTDPPARIEKIMDELASFMGRVNTKHALFPHGRDSNVNDDSFVTSVHHDGHTNACTK